MAAVSPDQLIGRAAVLWRRSGDQVMIRRRGNDSLVVLADSGVALWLALGEPMTLAELTGLMARRHEETTERIGSDVKVAIERLIDDGVVVAS